MKNILLILFTVGSIISNAQDSLSIFFEFDSDKINKFSEEKLNSIKGKSIFAIYGFADSRGSNLYNKNLAQKRINATINYLGINQNTISQIFAKGEDNLISTIHAENRKVVIYFAGSSLTSSAFQSEKSVRDEIVKAKVGDKIKLKALNFQPGLDILLPEAVPTLEELLEVMKTNRNLVIQIQGHICCATADFSDLSTARAFRVYEYLINNGIQSERISYFGFGVSQPLYKIPEKSTVEEIANRRVEIKIISN